MDKQSQLVQFPRCPNGQQARMVCLSGQCENYPFFCTNCEEPSCETPHQHQDKLTSISYKQFAKRVLKDPKPVPKLSQAMDSYRVVLQKLRQDVNQFIAKQLGQLDLIDAKASTLPSEDFQIVKVLKNKQFQGLRGIQMDQLWTRCAAGEQKVQAQEEAADFIVIKEQEVKGISEHFQHLNQMDYQHQNQDSSKGQGVKEADPSKY